MSHLRAPANRADRREGGRHGRPVARPAPALPETHIRPQLMRLAVLPPIAVALGAVAAVVFCIRSSRVPTSLGLWAVLAGALVVAAAGIAIAAVAADRAARSVGERVGALRRGAARGEADLRTLVDALRKGEAPPQRKPRRRPPEDADDFELLAADLARAHDGAVTAVVRAAQLSSQAGSEQKLEVFVNLARRLQSLVHREISILDELENEIEDPDLLKGLFHVDHLATRIRRHAENLAVLGGAVSRRQWSNPVDMTEVLRSAIAEVEQYSRVKLVPPIDGELRGHAVADVIHLLAELVENATVFSAPQTQVLLRANLVTSGLAVEVEDRGLGMPVDEQHRMNALLADPDQVNVASLLADGRIGLYVVSQLARRHGIGVRLQTNIYGGVQAVLVIPQALLGPAPGVMSGVPGAVGAGEGVGQAQIPSGPGELTAAVGRPSLVSGATTDDASGAESAPGDTTRVERGAGTAPGGAVGGDAGRDSGAGESGGSVGRTWAAGPAPSGGGTAGQAPGSGRGRHAQGASGGGGTPPPLPTRGAQERRPNPAEAVPGVSAEDRSMVEANMGALPTPRVGGAVRGTMERPRLPRRRAQEHIVPQLRGGPAPRQDGDTVAGHDPGLMAAFQRGIGLAETQQHVEATGSGYPEAPSEEGAVGMATGHMGPGYVAAPHVEVGHMSTDYMAPEHTELGSLGAGTSHMDAEHMGTRHMVSGHMGADHMVALHMEPAAADPGAVEPTHMESAHMSPDHTTAATHTGPLPLLAPTDQPPTPMDAPPIPTTPPHTPDHHDASPPSA
ncbi:ATP-binding protein [Streptomyces sp. NPDC003656]